MNYKNDKIAQRAIIIENYENPNKKVDEDFNDSEFKSYNFSSSSCIDNLTLLLKIDNNIVKEAFFKGVGCAVSTASANIVCNRIININSEEVLEIIKNYEKMIVGEEFNSDLLKELNIFIDIKNQPNRINCALIASKSIKEILIRNKNGE